jgi:hypothetical protein
VDVILLLNLSPTVWSNVTMDIYIMYFNNDQISQYLNSTLENLLFTSQCFGLSGISLDGRHMSVDSILSNVAEVLFFRFQGSLWILEKIPVDGTRVSKFAFHMLIRCFVDSFDVSFDVGAVQISDPLIDSSAASVAAGTVVDVS